MWVFHIGFASVNLITGEYVSMHKCTDIKQKPSVSAKYSMAGKGNLDAGKEVVGGAHPDICFLLFNLHIVFFKKNMQMDVTNPLESPHLFPHRDTELQKTALNVLLLQEVWNPKQPQSQGRS